MQQKSPDRLALYLLGPPRFEKNDVACDLKRRKVVALIAYLAVSGQAHGRESLTELLFPDQDRERALADFRNTLSILRAAVGARRLGVDRRNVRLDAEIWCDVREFRTRLQEARDPKRRWEGPEREKLLVGAAELYRGQFLAGFGLKDSAAFDDWQLFQQDNLERECAWLLGELVRHHVDNGQFEAAIEYARRWLCLDPLEEAVHRRLMDLYSLAGRRSAALRQYEKCRAILKKELGEEPDEETERLHEQIRSRPSRSVAAIRAPGAVPPGHPGRRAVRDNLPCQPEPLIGRQEEMAQLADLLRGEGPRILTLTGPAGVGKTRLALQVAAGLDEQFPQGIFFVDLAPLRDPGQVIPALADALDIREAVAQAHPLLQILKGYLRNRRVLVILDNFEHLLAAAPPVAELTEATARLRVLVTSREALHLRNEREFPVLPLPLPETGLSAAELAGCHSVRLLQERGAAVRPGFAVTDENADAIARICQRLDGLPLAIELAASRLKVLSAQEVADLLSQRLDVLKAASSGPPDRQQTLTRAIDWSYDLLAREKGLFAGLSVFLGGCSPEAVERVCAWTVGMSKSDLLDGLASLVDKNLLRRAEVNGETRFSMLETLREYARSKLEDSGQAEELRQNHAGYFLQLATAAEAGLHGPQQAVWMNLLEREGSNLQAALEWFLRRGAAKQALRLAAALEWFWYRHGDFNAGRQWLERALGLKGPRGREQLRARAVRALAWMVFLQGDWVRARALYKESLQLLGTAGDQSTRVAALSGLGVSERWLGEREAGTEHVEEAVRIAREANESGKLAAALIWAYATTGGRFPGRAPRAELEEALELSRKDGDPWVTAHALNGLGDLLREREDLAAARVRYEQALRGFRELKDRWMTAWCLEGLGTVLYRSGDLRGAEERFGESLSLFALLGDRGNSTYMLGRLGMAAHAQHDLPRAAYILGAFQALHEGGESESPELLAALQACRHGKQWADGQAANLEQAVERVLEGFDDFAA
jgi:predicted ATPase/DNA-binding SARP family transcriptional activator